MDWKEQALADFRDWVDALPDETPAFGGMAVNSCDLFTLLSEFTALRQEIRMQNREQYRTLNTLDHVKTDTDAVSAMMTAFSKECAAVLAHIRTSVDTLESADQQVRQGLDDDRRREIEKRTALPFLDIRDALVRGCAAARTATTAKGLFRRPPKGIDGVVEGYEMAIRRFDRVLHAVGIRPVETVGLPFDAACMRAVEIRKVPDVKSGVVVEELRGGFTRDDEIIRTAEVAVAK